MAIRDAHEAAVRGRGELGHAVKHDLQRGRQHAANHVRVHIGDARLERGRGGVERVGGGGELHEGRVESELLPREGGGSVARGLATREREEKKSMNGRRHTNERKRGR